MLPHRRTPDPIDVKPQSLMRAVATEPIVEYATWPDYLLAALAALVVIVAALFLDGRPVPGGVPPANQAQAGRNQIGGAQ